MRDNKVLFKIKCADNDNMPWFTVGKVYNFISSRGLIDDEGKGHFLHITDIDRLFEIIRGKWELVEETLLDKFYDLLGVEDMEEFYISDGVCTEKNKFRFRFGILQKNLIEDKWGETGSHYIGYLLKNQLQIIKLPPKPQLTNAQKKEINYIFKFWGECWLARGTNKRLKICTTKPYRVNTYDEYGSWCCEGKEWVSLSDGLSFIQWEDTEPFKIDKQLIESLEE